TIDLSDLVRETVVALSALAGERRVTLEQNVGSALQPLALRAQPGRLRSVLLNLVGNAIEHNRPGGTVRMSAEVAGRDLRLSIADTGPGIAAQHVPHLFDPFYRVDKARASGDGHLG